MQNRITNSHWFICISDISCRSSLGRFDNWSCKSQQQRGFCCKKCYRWTKLEFWTVFIFFKHNRNNNRYIYKTCFITEWCIKSLIWFVGYGHVTPLSRIGKIFCIVFAVVGIPLTLVLLSALVERLLVPTIWLLQLLNSRLGHLYQPFNIRVLHLFVIGR